MAGALGVTLALAVINWLAYTEEEAVGMLYLLPFWLAGAGYFAVLVAHSAAPTASD
ncbi:MAG: hypothetical protein R2867_17470 [Caldilineaceae bacterium]